MPIAVRIPLNPAQSRNLRNWAAADLPAKTLRVAVAVAPPVRPAVARQALGALIRRHEALRSRLVRDEAGEFVQEVADTAELIIDEFEHPAARSGGHVGPVPLPPEERAARARLHLRAGAVVLVELTVSHVFCDGMGRQVLARDLGCLLRGDLPGDPAPGQARMYARVPADPGVRENTDGWKRLLADAPRSCTYTGARRDEHEKAAIARIPLTDAELEPVSTACRRLRTTPNALWAAATSIMVSRMCGQHRQVFRSTYANRFTRADMNAVAQVAQAIFVPVAGAETDTLRHRARCVTHGLLSTYAMGMYDANDLLDWLNQPERSRGACFQPAFEVTYVPRLTRHPTDALVPQQAGPALAEADVRIDPPSAKADLVVLVAHAPGPGPVLQIDARRPVSDQCDAMGLARRLLLTVRTLAEEPDLPISDVPIPALPSVDRLLTGHVSGVALDPGAIRGLILSGTGVESCELELAPGEHGSRRLLARIRTRGRVNAAELREELRCRQPWWSGAVVPDELIIAP